MKHIKPLATLFLFICLFSDQLVAKSSDLYQRLGYTLTFENQDPYLDEALKARMVETFFYMYPTLVKNFNQRSVRDVTFLIDTAYTGVAEAGGGVVRFSSHWLRTHPEDIDVITHELMHLVQAYPNEAGPWWVTEGIADYVRYTFGVDNEGAGWSLTAYNDAQNFDNGYRITARFFFWIENKNPGFIKQLDNAMRTKTYNEFIWEKLTDKQVDDLWKEYGKNPVI